LKKACECVQGALAAAAAAEEERRECVADMRALLDAQIATTTAVLDHAAVEKAVAEARHAALIPAAAAVLLLVYAAITVESHCTLWRRILSRMSVSRHGNQDLHALLATSLLSQKPQSSVPLEPNQTWVLCGDIISELTHCAACGCIICSLAELGERVEQLQGERAALAAQLADTEAERDAAAGAAAAASAEAAAADRLNRLLEVRAAVVWQPVIEGLHASSSPCAALNAITLRAMRRCCISLGMADTAVQCSTGSGVSLIRFLRPLPLSVAGGGGRAGRRRGGGRGGARGRMRACARAAGAPDGAAALRGRGGGARAQPGAGLCGRGYWVHFIPACPWAARSTADCDTLPSDRSGHPTAKGDDRCARAMLQGRHRVWTRYSHRGCDGLGTLPALMGKRPLPD
jgi:hypothetical protein